MSEIGNIDMVQKKNAKVWSNIVDWVHHGGGHIHEALQLQGTGISRGIFATHAIPSGKWLIRLPPSCVISGSCVNGKSVENSSSWLKCVAAYFRAKNEIQSPTSSSSDDDDTKTTLDNWQPYFDSLPDEYETLFQWTDEEVGQYLAGTTLGTLIQTDRAEQSMRQRYQLAVRPVLKLLGLIEQDRSGTTEDATASIADSEYDGFLRACMCISTRGFHLTTNEDVVTSSNEAKNYGGPFLLPIIDLLNHDPSKKCTTLQRDNSMGMFCMKAERAIQKGEEVIHSYGDNLTAAELLQTFGFVPASTNPNPSNWTPASLSKMDHLLAACNTVKTSNITSQIQGWMATQHPDDDSWDVAGIPDRPLNESVPNAWLISNDSVLTDELITFLVLQYLPEDAYDEICPDGNISSWLDRSILEDLYLGKLVCYTLQEAIKRKKVDYAPVIRNMADDSDHPDALERDQQARHSIQTIQDPSTTDIRAMQSLRIRIEELKCLDVLSNEISRILACLDNGESIELAKPPTKRTKQSQNVAAAE